MRHVGALAGRELRSLFVSPVAWVVLALWSLLAGFFFLSQWMQFEADVLRLQQVGAFVELRALNLNDNLLVPFFGAMWVVLLFAIPGISMGLLASEKANRTEELLLTTPISISEIVLGKYLAGAAFASAMVAIVAFYPGLLFVYGDPEWGKTLSGLLGLWAVSLSYVAVGLFASSLTRNLLVAFFVSLGLLMSLLMLPLLAELGASGPAFSSGDAAAEILRWLSTAEHFERMAMGWIDTSDLFYFVAFPAVFLILARTSIESSRWR
ncbi:MAG: ABC transporter permease [Myxococcota bacterium]